PMPLPATPAGDGPAASEGREGRARTVLVVGLAVLALALAGLTYALLNRSNGDGGTEGSGGSRSPGASSAAPSRTGDSTEPSPSTGSSGSGTGTSAPPQSVTVSVTGAHTHYAGSCPPPYGQAPAFTATFTAGRLPAEVRYRWVTEDGKVSDKGWKTLSFPADGGRSRQDTVVVTTDDDSGAFESTVRVEVRKPVEVTSDAVAFSVTCETETPTGGASPSSSSSASPSASGQAAPFRTGR
ncbi:serine/threonine protein kinase, partial [Streptomyces sp. SID5910]|nr:serine/threonine protein kinase [Streptomyces sp. SID5910]